MFEKRVIGKKDIVEEKDAERWILDNLSYLKETK